jgi:ribosome-binding protein aMBF1 (putative translation factor)
MRKLDLQKLAKLPTYNQLLDEQYGEVGSDERHQFDEESLAWFYGNMLRERRQELKLTQKQLAEKLGKEQSYIARVESGKTDVQLSSFVRIAAMLGIQFVPTFIHAAR